MPLTIPPFTSYQGPLFPLRGLWNSIPREGDRYVAIEIDWGSYPAGQAVSFSLSGHSPVAISQVVALSVDNARCGTDVQFLFGDSGFVLQVPSHCQGVYPVFTNGLGFYAIALGAGNTDITNLNVHNSMPPTIAVQVTLRQNSVHVTGVATTNGTTLIVPPPASGTLNDGTIVIDYVGTAATTRMTLNLIDGNGQIIWSSPFTVAANAIGTATIALTDIAVRFNNGLSLQVAASTVTGNSIVINAYYTVP